MTSPDIILLRKWARRRDAEAFNEIVSRYAGMVFATCKRVLGNAADAEDVAQECFMRLAQGSVPPRGSLGGWLHTLATCRSLDRLRAEKRRRRYEQRAMEDASSSTEAGWDDVQAYVDEAIEGLPEKYREPIVRHFFQRETHEAIARDLGVTRSAVTQRIHRGIEQIRKTLKRRGVIVLAAALATMMAAKTAEAAPVALTTALAKLAIAGTASKTAGTTTAGAAAAQTLGGLIAMKKTIAALAIVVAFAFGAYKLSTGAFPWERGTSDEPAPAKREQSRTTTDAPEKGPGETGGVSRMESTVSVLSVSEASTHEEQATAGEQALQGGAVTGRVYDAKTGQGIEGVRVLADGDGKRDNQVESDDDGYYCIAGLADGTYEIVALGADGYPSTNSCKKSTVTISRGETVEGIDFLYDKGIRIAGIVVDAAGQAVDGASVRATMKNRPHISGRGKSDPDGSFEVFMAPLAGDDLVLAAHIDELESEMLGPLTLTSAGLDGLLLTLSVPRKSTISGVVVDPHGRPKPGVAVHLDRREVRYLLYTPIVRTADDGSFEILHLAAGNYGIVLSPPGIETWHPDNYITRVVLREAHALTGLRLVFGSDKGGLAIAGYVVDTAGKPVKDASIYVWGPANGNAGSDATGAYRISGLAEGVYALSAQRPGYTATDLRGVEAGDENIEIVLRGMASVEGRVLRADTGEAITDFELFFVNGAHDRVEQRLFSNGRRVRNAEGRFVLDKVYVGDVTVTARATGFAPAFQALRLVEYETITDVELRLEPVDRFEGQVVNTAGLPVPNAYVFLREVPHESDILSKSVARSGADGTFVIDSISPDISVIAAYHPDYAPGAVNVYEETVIVLPEGGTLEGIVTLNGGPLPEASVAVSYSLPGETHLPYSSTKSDRNGRYRFTGLGPGTVRVDARYQSDFWTVAEAVIVAGQTTALDLDILTGSATLEGRITRNGAPTARAGAGIEVFASSGHQTYSVKADTEGHYRVENMPAGQVRLRAHVWYEPDGFWTRTVEFELAEGETVRQDIDFSGQGGITGRLAGFSADFFSVVFVFPGEAIIPDTFNPQEALELDRSAVRQLECAEDGTFRTDGLEPGTYTVFAGVIPRSAGENVSQLRHTSSVVTITGDETVSVDFDFR